MHKKIQLKLATNNRLLRDKNLQIPPKSGFLVRRTFVPVEAAGPAGDFLFKVGFTDIVLGIKWLCPHLKCAISTDNT